MRARCLILAAVLALAACEQTADYVAGTQVMFDSGGTGGTGGTGGMGGAGVGGASGMSSSLPDDCDPEVTRAVLLFSPVETTCRYARADTALHELLTELIYMKPAPELTAVEAENNPDSLCAILRVVPWRIDFENGNIDQPDLSTVVICPRYCKALRQWLVDHHDRALQCVPDAGT